MEESGQKKVPDQLLNKGFIQSTRKEINDIRALYDDFVLEDVIKEDSENIPDGLLFRRESVYVKKWYNCYLCK